MINQIETVTFSPTGQTKGLVETMGRILSKQLDVPLTYTDFTLPENQSTPHYYGPRTLVLFSMPTYAGRLPNKALPLLQTLFKADEAPTVALVSFGNRSYDSSLTELRNELAKKKFLVFAAGAFPMPHAFADIGSSHPTPDDWSAFDEPVKGILDALSQDDPLHQVIIKGDAPVAPYYIPKKEDGQPAKFLKAKPKTDPLKCDHCGLCARVCPMGSISASNTDEVPGICIKCQACIRYCPRKAKYFDDPDFLSHKAMLESNYQELAKSEIFLPNK